MALSLITVSLEGRAVFVTTDDGVFLFATPQASYALGLGSPASSSLFGENVSTFILGATNLDKQPCPSLTAVLEELNMGRRVVLQTAGPRQLIAETERGPLTPSLAACIQRVRYPSELSFGASQFPVHQHMFDERPPHHLEWGSRQLDHANDFKPGSFDRQGDKGFFPTESQSRLNSSFDGTSHPDARPVDGTVRGRIWSSSSGGSVETAERGRLWSSSSGGSEGLAGSDGASSTPSSLGGRDFSGGSDCGGGGGSCGFSPAQQQSSTSLHQRNSSSHQLLCMFGGLNVAPQPLNHQGQHQYEAQTPHSFGSQRTPYSFTSPSPMPHERRRAGMPRHEPFATASSAPAASSGGAAWSPAPPLFQHGTPTTHLGLSGHSGLLQSPPLLPPEPAQRGQEFGTAASGGVVPGEFGGSLSPLSVAGGVSGGIGHHVRVAESGGGAQPMAEIDDDQKGVDGGNWGWFA